MESGDRGKNAGRTPVAPRGRYLWRVSPKWARIYRLFFEQPAPPLGYLQSLGLALSLKDALDDEDLRAIFEHTKPLEVQQYYWQQQPIVPAVVEAFLQLTDEPSFLHVTVSWNQALYTALLEVWPDVYADYLPCAVCTTVGALNGEERGGREDYVIERFHVSSKYFAKRMTLELHFDLERTRAPRPATAADIDKNKLHKIVIRLYDGSCYASSAREARKRKTKLFISDLASDVFGFIDRVHVGACLIANRRLKERIFKLSSTLPVHHLICEFGSEQIATDTIRSMPGNYSVALRHFVRDPAYADVRRFKLPSGASPACDCALIRRHLCKSYVVNFAAPYEDSRFTFRMIAALVGGNTAIGCLRFVVFNHFTTDYRSLGAVFGGGMRLHTLDISGLVEHSFIRLVKTTDFFRLPTVQGLGKLKIVLAEPYYRRAEMHRRQAKINPPAWLDGIFLLRNCAHYEVEYEADDVYRWRAPSLRRLDSIVRKLVHICEKFERGEILETCEHFKFTADDFHTVVPLNAANRIASAAEVEGNNFKWDVYRFRNAANGEWLTACVGTPPSYRAYCIVHLVKGEVFPDATFGRNR